MGSIKKKKKKQFEGWASLEIVMGILQSWIL